MAEKIRKGRWTLDIPVADSVGAELKVGDLVAFHWTGSTVVMGEIVSLYGKSRWGNPVAEVEPVFPDHNTNGFTGPYKRSPRDLLKILGSVV